MVPFNRSDEIETALPSESDVTRSDVLVKAGNQIDAKDSRVCYSAANDAQ